MDGLVVIKWAAVDVSIARVGGPYLDFERLGESRQAKYLLPWRACTVRTDHLCVLTFGTSDRGVRKTAIGSISWLPCVAGYIRQVPSEVDQ